jgi:hypothetical protein
MPVWVRVVGAVIAVAALVVLLTRPEQRDVDDK